MHTSRRFALALSAAILTAPAIAHGHFKLVEPASWIVENERGDPQKSGPCGGSNTDWGKPTNTVTKATGGQKLHIKVQETIYHPGHYRVALAVNSPNDLPLDPEATTRDGERGPISVSAKVQDPVAPPVLADGLFVHATKPTGTMPPWETDVQLPNINCRKCTLQIVQFMAEHGFNNPGGYTYHHCATLEITVDPKKPIDKAWPADR
ncbi:MAG TPA: SCE4755 family polysaccharide monooxygenase-like protein [Vicinamibacterales bacterium]